MGHARRFLAAIATPELDELVLLHQPVDDLFSDHWSLTGDEVPDADSPDEAMFLPGRNPLLLVKARMWCAQNEIDTLALGALASNPFLDASDAFLATFGEALNLTGMRQVRLTKPLAARDKRSWMLWGSQLPLELTFSCVHPTNGLHCGRCNKCAERHAAFQLADCRDPTQYASSLPATASRTFSNPIATKE
jgi:7-cyano-7-deazaguanine synthase